MRFPNEDVSKLTMQQLRGREGSRIRKAYEKEAEIFGIKWNGREYKPDDKESSDDVNAALSIANSCLYGIAYAVICSLGCIPSLGFVHTGHQRSFVYDIADLYKTETSIPVAFKIASTTNDNIWRSTRTEMRKSIKENHILEKMVRDVQTLLDPDFSDDDLKDVVTLWGPDGDIVPAGTQYSKVN